MAIEVTTKDCTALTDAEMGEMADLCATGRGWEAGLLSKQAEEWVLVSQAFQQSKLVGFCFTTLERIGGTPSLLFGVGCVGRTRNRSSVLKALASSQFHKTLMAFPDEDVVVATRVDDVGPYDLLSELVDVRPWPETRANGEERAWGRRLAKRFGSTDFDDRTMRGRTEDTPLVFDYESGSPQPVDAIVADCRLAEGEHVIAWGWAMAEFLERFEKVAA